MIYLNGTLYPIEIKKTASPGKAAIKNFNVLNGPGTRKIWRIRADEGCNWPRHRYLHGQ